RTSRTSKCPSKHPALNALKQRTQYHDSSDQNRPGKCRQTNDDHGRSRGWQTSIVRLSPSLLSVSARETGHTRLGCGTKSHWIMKHTLTANHNPKRSEM